MRNRLFTHSRRRMALVGALVAGLIAPVAAASGTASAAITPTTSWHYLEGVANPVKIRVSGFDGTIVYASITTTYGADATIGFGTTTGLTLAFGYTSFTASEVAFTGTQDAVNAALQTMTVTPKTTTNQVLSVRTTFFEFKDSLAYNPANQHFYKFVPGAITATAAATAAAATTELGLTGYLATITSSSENDFVSSKIYGAQNVWINGTDAVTEETWKYSGGPEDGTTFFQGCGATGAAVNGAFVKWNPDGEPNNWVSNTNKCGGTAYAPNAAAGEDCIVTNWTASYVPAAYRTGYWNDLPCDYTGTTPAIGGYVAEFGKADSTFAGVQFDTFTLVKDLPARKLTPAQTFVSFFNKLVKNMPKGFTLKVKKPATKKVQAQTITCPATFRKTRFSYTLIFTEAGRYSFYFTNANGRRIPMECGTRIKTRVITEPISAPVIQTVKDGERPVITAYLRTSAIGDTMDYPQLNVILKRADGTLVRQDQPNPPLPGTPIDARGVARGPAR